MSPARRNGAVTVSTTATRVARRRMAVAPAAALLLVLVPAHAAHGAPSGHPYRLAFIAPGTGGQNGAQSTVANAGGRILHAADGDFGRITLHDAASGAVLRTIDAPGNPSDVDFAGAAAASPHGFLASAPGLLSCFLFTRSGALRATLQAGGTSAFGFAVAWMGDVLVVGDPGEGTTFHCEPNGSYSDVRGPGGVFLFEARSGGLLRHVANPDGTDAAFFGAAVTRCRGGFCVGAPGELFIRGTLPGSVYVFDRRGRHVETLTAPMSVADDRFGSAIAASGAKLLVGAPRHPPAGAAFLFAFERGAWTLVRTLTSPTPEVFSAFGAAVALVGDRVLVGAPARDTESAAYLFDAASGELLATVMPPPPLDPELGPYYPGFGTSVAIIGTTIAVGSRVFDEGDGTSIFGFRPDSTRGDSR